MTMRFHNDEYTDAFLIGPVEIKQNLAKRQTWGVWYSDWVPIGVPDENSITSARRTNTTCVISAGALIKILILTLTLTVT